jgi:hypothetical protein
MHFFFFDCHHTTFGTPCRTSKLQDVQVQLHGFASIHPPPNPPRLHPNPTNLKTHQKKFITIFKKIYCQKIFKKNQGKKPLGHMFKTCTIQICKENRSRTIYFEAMSGQTFFCTRYIFKYRCQF